MGRLRGLLGSRLIKTGAIVSVAAGLAVTSTLAVPANAAGWQGFSFDAAPSEVGTGTSPAWALGLTTDLGGPGADIWNNNHHLNSEAIIDVASSNSSIVTASELGGAGSIDTHGVSFTDIDGDGDEDLVEIMGRDNENRVFRNDDGTLVPIAPGNLEDEQGRGRQPLPVDFDGDGDMDLLVANLDLRVAPANSPFGRPSEVYLNSGNGTSWTVASNPDGALSEGSIRMAQLTSTGPGTEQIIVTHNSFTIALDSIATGTRSVRDAAIPATTRTSVSHFRDAVLGDFDGDLHPELVVARGNASNSAGNWPMEIFDLVEGDSPVAVPDLPVHSLIDNCRSVAAGDFDNDGDLDIFGGCTQLQDGQQRNIVLLNDGVGNFSIGGGDLVPRTSSDTAAALAVGDLNGDGWLDVFVGNGYDFETAPDLIATNNGGVGANYLSVELEGSNPDAAGTQVFVRTNEWQVRETGHRTRRGQDARALHFGLGSATSVAPLEIMWPDGTFESCTVSGINRTVTVTQGASNCRARTAAQFQATIGANPPAADTAGPVVTPLTPATGRAMAPRAAAVFGRATDDTGVGRIRVRVRRNIANDLTYWNGSDWVSRPSWVDAVINPSGSWILRGVDFTENGAYRIWTHGTDEAGNVSNAANNGQLRFTVR